MQNIQQLFTNWIDSLETKYMKFSNQDNDLSVSVWEHIDEGRYKYYDFTVEVTIKSSGFFGRKKEEVFNFRASTGKSYESIQTFDLIENTNNRQDIEWQKEQASAQYWWNLLCNQYCYLMEK